MKVQKFAPISKRVNAVQTYEQLIGAADADWASNENRRSYTGYCFKFGGALVSWESRKQRTVALSTSEAEYMSMTEAAKEAIHLKQLIKDMGKPHSVIQLFNDNQSAIAMAKNSIVSNKSKHISIREHFIREKVQNGEINVNYKPPEDMVADILTET